jgi:hypothetical protein
MNRIILAAAIVGFLQPALAAEDTPEAFLTTMYDRIQNGFPRGKHFSPLSRPNVPKYFSKRATDALFAAWKKDPGVIDVDPFTDSQDPDISDIIVKRLANDKCTAKVEASFMNYGERTRILFDMVRVKEGWRISDIKTAGQMLSAAGRKGPLPPEKPAC